MTLDDFSGFSVARSVSHPPDRDGCTGYILLFKNFLKTGEKRTGKRVVNRTMYLAAQYGKHYTDAIRFD